MSLVRVVVLTHNSASHVGECLQSLRSQNSIAPEIVVVDNASTDETLWIVMRDFPEVSIIRNAINLGYSQGNNQGLQPPLPQYIAVVNPDTIAHPDWLTTVISEMISHPRAGMCQAKLLLYSDGNRLNSRGNEANVLFFGWPDGYGDLDTLEDETRTISFASGCALLLRRECVEATLGFDASYFMYGEDLDLSIRAFLRGWDCIYSPKAVVFHKYEYREYTSKYFLLERNRFYTLIKAYRLRTCYLLFPLILATEIGVLAKSLHEGWLTTKILSYGSILANLVQLLRKRRDVQMRRIRGDNDLIRLLKGPVNFGPIGQSGLLSIGNRVFSKYRHFLDTMSL